MSSLSAEQMDLLFDLLGDLRDDCLTAERHALLQAQVLQSPEACEVYVQFQYLCGNLFWTYQPEAFSAQSLAAPAAPTASNATPTSRLTGTERLYAWWRLLGRVSAPQFFMVGGLAAVVICLFTAYGLQLLPFFGDSTRYKHAADADIDPNLPRDFVGSVISARDPVWRSAATLAPGVASRLYAEYELVSGRIEMVLGEGAHVAIEGPAHWRLASVQRLELRQGRVSAFVPPGAIGFTVATPAVDVVDLGTRFLVNVDNAGSADVGVTQGLVQLALVTPKADRPAATRQLPAGKAVTVTPRDTSKSRIETSSQREGVASQRAETSRQSTEDVRPPDKPAADRSLASVDLPEVKPASLHQVVEAGAAPPTVISGMREGKPYFAALQLAAPSVGVSRRSGKRVSFNLGRRFTVLRPIVVFNLGAYDSGQDGLRGKIPVSLYRLPTEGELTAERARLVAQERLTTANSELARGSAYRFLKTPPTPILLEPGEYMIVGSDYGGPGREPYTNDYFQIPGREELFPAPTTHDGGGLLRFGESYQSNFVNGQTFPDTADWPPVANHYSSASFLYYAASANEVALRF